MFLLPIPLQITSDLRVHDWVVFPVAGIREIVVS